jgi:hypothetical protein
MSLSVSLLPNPPYGVPVITENGTTTFGIQPSSVTPNIKDVLAFGTIIEREKVVKLYNDNIQLANLAQKLKNQNYLLGTKISEYQSKEREYQQKLATESTQVQGLSSIIKQGQDRTQEQQRLIQEITTANSVLQTQVTENKSLIARFETDIRNKDQSLGEIRQQLQRVEDELRKQTMIASGCASQSNLAEEKIRRGDDTLRQVKTDYENKIRVITNDLKAELSKVRDENGELKRRLDSQNDNMLKTQKQFTQQIQTLQERLSQQIKENVELKSQFESNSDNTKRVTTQALTTLQARLAEKEQEIELKNRELKQLQERTLKESSDIQTLQSQNKKLSDDYSQVKAKFDELVIKCGTCDEQNKTLFADVANRFNEVKKANERYQVTQFELTKKVEDLTAIQKATANQLASSEQQKKVYQDEIYKLTSDNRDLQQQVNNLKSINSEAFNKCKQQEKELKELKQGQVIGSSLLIPPPNLSTSLLSSGQCQPQIDSALGKCNEGTTLLNQTIEQLRRENLDFRRLITGCPERFAAAEQEIKRLQGLLQQNVPKNNKVLIPLPPLPSIPPKNNITLCKDERQTIENLRQNLQDDQDQCNRKTIELNNIINNNYLLLYRAYFEYIVQKVDELDPLLSNPKISLIKRQTAANVKSQQYSELRKLNANLEQVLEVKIDNQSITQQDTLEAIYRLTYFAINNVLIPMLATLQ